MAKAKRMSDTLASSGEQDTSGATTGTPPYSSEGPTLSFINGGTENVVSANAEGLDAADNGTGGDRIRNKNSRNHDQEGSAASQSQPSNTNHPGLYEPWTLLPREIFGPLLAQSRLADVQNAVPIVFTKNQNVKSGVVRLKTYLGAHVDRKHPMDIPDILKEQGSVIAISAQGEGTAKLVTILDMAKRVVKPGPALPVDDSLVENWWMYMSLASVEMEQKKRIDPEATVQANTDAAHEAQEDEVFEPMEVDFPEQKTDEARCVPKCPVLTVWLSRKEMLAFKEAFGGEKFTVLNLPKEA